MDAAPFDLSAILTQIYHSKDGDREVKVVSYASRACRVTDVESLATRRRSERLWLFVGELSPLPV